MKMNRTPTSQKYSTAKSNYSMKRLHNDLQTTFSLDKMSTSYACSTTVTKKHQNSESENASNSTILVLHTRNKKQSSLPSSIPTLLPSSALVLMTIIILSLSHILSLSSFSLLPCVDGLRVSNFFHHSKYLIGGSRNPSLHLPHISSSSPARNIRLNFPNLRQQPPSIRETIPSSIYSSRSVNRARK